MWATSTDYTTALLSGSRRWATRVEVLWADSVVAALSVVSDGKVSIDQQAVRRSLTATLIDADGSLTPADARDLLSPKGTEIRVYRGLLVAGEYEWVPLGVFGVNQPTVTAHNDGTKVELRAYDRVDAIRQRRFTMPWTVPSGTPTADAISDIVTSRLDVPVRITSTGHTAPESVFDELSDPWDAVRALAEADTLVAYFDPLGTLVVTRDDPVDTGITFAPGESSLLLGVSRTMSAEKTYSGVIVKGEHPDKTPIRVELWDVDPASPTYAFGPFGKRPYGFTSSLVTTEGMAREAAETIMNRVTRMAQEIEIEIIGHPGHDVGDGITVEDPESRTSGYYAVTAAEIPLRPGPITLKARQVIS